MITLLGWIGALLALVAYAQTGTIRFRQIALLSSVALLTFALLLGIWSNVVLESALGIVNLRRLVQLRQSVGSSGAIAVLGVPVSRPTGFNGRETGTANADIAPRKRRAVLERLSRGRRAARPRPGRQPAVRAPAGRTTGLVRPDVG